ncbi:MAG: hypothetical protein ACYTEN_12390 [Planctomycetota bacterium]
MNKSEWKKLAWIVGGFLVCFYLPIGIARFNNAIMESLALVKWYAREHVLLCLVPAFFIAGGIACFVSQGSVMKYLGPKANRGRFWRCVRVRCCRCSRGFTGWARGWVRRVRFCMRARPSMYWRSS